MDKEKCKNPTCENELVHKEGRRKKKYCSAACKNKINLANYYERNKKEAKTINIPMEQYKKLLEKVAEDNKPKNNGYVSKDQIVVNKHEQVVASHPLWKKGDPLEGSNAFYFRYGCYNYEELSQLKN